jgi:hypothetical protein
VTPHDRRALLRGGAVVAGAIVVLRVVPWGVRHVVSARTDLRERAVLLVRARAELAGVGALEDSGMHVIRALRTIGPKLLNGNTPAEAGADLAGRLTLVASRHNLKLERMNPSADSAGAGRLRRVGVRVELESDIRGLSALLQTLADGDATLRVEELRLVAVDPSRGDALPEALKTEITLSGWYVGRPAADTSTLGPTP